MRRFIGAVTVSVLVLSALPARARVFTDRETSWMDRARTRVMLFIKRFEPKSLGDMLTVPRP
ncbi:MAG TPA: hypothetical protein VEK11_01145 [Thermoanaerobaculia bacterium]|jgi:hypothetical protein|nr:hypothetical protein [Thermoanaerobaculia bacterium]